MIYIIKTKGDNEMNINYTFFIVAVFNITIVLVIFQKQ